MQYSIGIAAEQSCTYIELTDARIWISKNASLSRVLANRVTICVYAPIAAAPPGVQSKFRYDLQDIIDAVPQENFLVLLGDFNARVGVLGPGLRTFSICTQII